MALLKLFVFLAFACGAIALIAHHKKATDMARGFVWFSACYFAGAVAIATSHFA